MGLASTRLSKETQIQKIVACEMSEVPHVAERLSHLTLGIFLMQNLSTQKNSGVFSFAEINEDFPPKPISNYKNATGPRRLLSYAEIALRIRKGVNVVKPGEQGKT